MSHRGKDDVSIFEFDSFAGYLTSVYKQRKRNGRASSLRTWASELGMKATDASNLSRVLSGRREPSKTVAQKIVSDLFLDEIEIAYFEILSLGHGKVSRASLAHIRESLRRFSVAGPIPPGEN